MLCIELDDEALERKLRAAKAYPELADEVTAALTAWGADAFRKEYCGSSMRATRSSQARRRRSTSGSEKSRWRPVCDRVIRYRTHISRSPRPCADTPRTCGHEQSPLRHVARATLATGLNARAPRQPLACESC
jgi:hypothetical protein